MKVPRRLKGLNIEICARAYPSQKYQVSVAKSIFGFSWATQENTKFVNTIEEALAFITEKTKDKINWVDA